MQTIIQDQNTLEPQLDCIPNVLMNYILLLVIVVTVSEFGKQSLSFLPCQKDSFISVNQYLWRNIGRWRRVCAVHCVCMLFIWLFGEYSTLTLHEPVDFITAECGLLCGSFTSNRCSLYWERIHGCHAISSACQEHAHERAHTRTSTLYTVYQPTTAVSPVNSGKLNNRTSSLLINIDELAVSEV